MKFKQFIQENKVDDYLEKLEKHLYDFDKFPEIYDQLANDKSMKTADIHDLAKKFAAIKGSSKTESLRKIWQRHESLIRSKQAAKAIAGRSAA